LASPHFTHNPFGGLIVVGHYWIGYCESADLGDIKLLNKANQFFLDSSNSSKHHVDSPNSFSALGLKLVLSNMHYFLGPSKPGMLFHLKSWRHLLDLF